MNPNEVDTSQVQRILRRIIWPESKFVPVVLIYGLAISLLTLAVPVAVQTLVNTVVNTAAPRAVFSLATVLLFTLLLSGFFSALRTYVMELYERHIYARLSAQISARTLQAQHSVFDGRRNVDLTYRYFDIGILQKNVPTLMVDGFALILQMIVGFSLVSTYHATLFVFNAVVIGAIVVICLFLWKSAIRTAVMLSHSKYAMAKWLGNLGAAHDFFKANQHLEFAAGRTDELANQYIDHHEMHFRFTFAQTILFLLLYALASAGLLGIGGWLVIRGELSVGQLVASELILTAIFFGLSRFGHYLKLYYEMCGAADELNQILSVPQEPPQSEEGNTPSSGELAFHHVGANHYPDIRFHLQSGAKVPFYDIEPELQRHIVQLLKYQKKPNKGWIQFGDKSLEDYDLRCLRQAITVVDRSQIIDCTVYEYLHMAAPNASIADMWQALNETCMAGVIEALPESLNNHLGPSGSPLLPHQFVLLKLTAALLTAPKVLLLTQYFDQIDNSILQKIMATLAEKPFTVLYFTNLPEVPKFDPPLDLAGIVRKI